MKKENIEKILSGIKEYNASLSSEQKKKIQIKRVAKWRKAMNERSCGYKVRFKYTT